MDNEPDTITQLSSGQRLHYSFGGMLTILSFLSQEQQTVMQAASKFMYQRGVARIQIKISCAG